MPCLLLCMAPLSPFWKGRLTQAWLELMVGQTKCYFLYYFRHNIDKNAASSCSSKCNCARCTHPCYPAGRRWDHLLHKTLSPGTYLSTNSTLPYRSLIPKKDQKILSRQLCDLHNLWGGDDRHRPEHRGPHQRAGSIILFPFNINPADKKAPFVGFRDQREWVFEVREVKSENKKLSLFFEKCKVKKK